MATNQNDQEAARFLVKFSNTSLACIDSFALEKRSASREEAFLIMLQTFAKKHGIEIPHHPLPQRPSLSSSLNHQGRHDLKHMVAVMVPKEWENGWLLKLMKVSGETSIKNLFRRSVSES